MIDRTRPPAPRLLVGSSDTATARAPIHPVANLGAPRGARRHAPRAATPVRYKPDLLVVVASTVILTSVWRVHDLIPPLGILKIALLATLVGLLMLLFDGKRSKIGELLRSPLSILMLCLFVQLTFSAEFGIEPAASRSFLVRDFLQNAVGLFIVAAAIRTPRDMRWLAGMHVVGAVIYCLFILLFDRHMDSSGRLANLIYYDANDLSLAIVCVIPFMLAFLRRSMPPGVRLMTLASFVPIILVFQLAGSRGGFLGLAVVAVAALFFYRGISVRTRFLSLAGGILVLVAIGGSSYRDKLDSIIHPEDDYNMTAAGGRVQVWKNALSLVRQRPIAGFGPRTFSEADGLYSDLALQSNGIAWMRAHDSYLEMAAEAGVFGVLCFVALLLVGLRVAWKCRSRAFALGPPGADLAVLSQSVVIAILGYLVSATFLSSEYLALIYFLIGMIIAAERLLRHAPRVAGAAPQYRRRAAPRVSTARQPGAAPA